MLKEFKWYFLYFFSWAAKNNRADLFNEPVFKELFIKFSDAAQESLLTAAAFGSKEYFASALVYAKKVTIRKAISLVILEHDQSMLVSITEALYKNDLTLKSVSHQCSERDELYSCGVPLYCAIHKDNIEALDYLLTNQVDVNGCEDEATKNTYLHYAINNGNIESVELLLHYGANVNAQNDSKSTPLHIAIQSNRWDIASILIHKFNAKMDVKDKADMTAIDYIKDEAVKNNLLFIPKEKQESTK